jgi:integrase
MGKLRQEKIAKGVTLQTYESGKQALRIEFQYKGIPCRETLKVSPNKTGVKYATNLKAEIENQIERGTFNYVDYFPNSKRVAIFGQVMSHQPAHDLLDDWLTDIKHAHRDSTYGAYNRAVKQLKPFVGIFKVRDIDVKIIKRMIRHWGHDRGVTLKTIRNYLLPLRAILDEAMSEGIITRNPLDQIKVAKLIDRKKIQANKSSYKVDPFNPKEITTILSCVEYLYGESARNLFQFGFYQGLRISELFGLKWIDIDWQHLRVRVERARVERVLQEETKTEAGEREVDLTNGGHEALVKQKKHSLLQPSGFIFLRPSDKGPFIAYEHSSTMWTRALSRGKIRYRNQNQMRHSFASNKLSGNTNLFYMVEQMGHKTPEMLMKVYAKWIKAARDNEKMSIEFEQKKKVEPSSNTSNCSQSTVI